MTPRLRPDLIFVAQTYRGEQSYIVKDPETHKYFRFRPVEALVMQELDGEHTAAEIAAGLAAQGLPFTAAAVEAFARRLNQMELLERSVAQRSVLQLERLRAERHRRVSRTHYNGSLLRMRWSVGDPNRFFDRWTPRLGFFFSRPFLAASVALFAAYFAIFFGRWTDVSHAIRALYSIGSYNLSTVILVWSTFMAIVAVHELGHGFTCKYFGGQVHEMGAMLIYFQPAFYCNVNDAWTFPDLRARLWVTAAGSWIQLVLAAIAALVWLVAAPDTLISQIALTAVVLGGVTTILANANPLIPLDGYYALSDYLEIPNLRQRALDYLAWIVRRHVLRLAVPAPAVDDRERRVFLIYAPLALAYSTTILVLVVGGLFGWVSRTLGALGALAFAFAAWAALRGTILGWGRAVATTVREHRAAWGSSPRRRRAVATALAVAGAGLLPWPITVHGDFVAAAPFALSVKAPEGAVVAQVFAAEGQRVAAGVPLVQLRNLSLEREAVSLRWLADSLAARETAARARGDVVRARGYGAERAEQEAAWEGRTARLRALTLRAPVAGTVVTPRLEELLGRWVPGGAVAVRIDVPDSVELRVVLERAGASFVRSGQPVAVLPFTNEGHALRATVSSVSTIAGAGLLEARVRVRRDDRSVRPGVTGEAKVTVRRSTVWGALWWGVRKRVRSDLLL